LGGVPSSTIRDENNDSPVANPQETNHGATNRRIIK
jgi:hypothetical protein